MTKFLTRWTVVLILSVCVFFPVQGRAEERGILMEQEHRTAGSGENTGRTPEEQLFLDYRALALSNWDSLDTAQRLRATRLSRKTDEILLVAGHSLTQWVKNADGSFTKILDAYCGYGRNGLSADRHEGDATTPIGAFPILHAFGTGENPGTAMTWIPVTPCSYWSDEGPSYNTWVESPVPVSGEHLASYYQYRYAMAIGFNRDPVVPGRGSAIFLHVKSRDTWSTSGCVSVTEENMVKILQQSHDGTYIVIVPDEAALRDF